MEPIAEYELKSGNVLRIYPDIDDTEMNNPRSWDNMGTMVCFHHRYELGDTNHGLYHSDFENWDDLEAYLLKERNAAMVLPIYMYDHSGITIRTAPFSCPWDSGQIGFIFVSKEKVRKEMNAKRITKKVLERVRDCLMSEVKVYDDYLTGNVYEYRVETPDGDFVDGCGGFYGDPDPHNNGMVGMFDDTIVKEL